MVRICLERAACSIRRGFCRLLDVFAAAILLVVSGTLVLIAVSEVSARDALLQRAEHLAQTDFIVQPPPEAVEAIRKRTRTLVEELIERGEAPNNDGIRGIRVEMKLDLKRDSARIESWDLRSPIEGATWAFARTRTDFLLANASMLSGLIGVFLSRLPGKRRVIDSREVLQGVALSLVSFLILRYGGQLAFVARSSDARDVKLNPFFASIVGLLCGLERKRFHAWLVKMLNDVLPKDGSPSPKAEADAENRTATLPEE
jgi:hypothetical protein